MIRILCVQIETGDAVNIGGPVTQTGKTFDVTCPDLEAWLAKFVDDKWTTRSVVAVEVRP